MSETTNTYTNGDEIKIGQDVITLQSRKNNTGTTIRWTWWCDQIGEGSEGTYTTAQAAIANAERTLGKGECRHGAINFCPTCHDRES